MNKEDDSKGPMRPMAGPAKTTLDGGRSGTKHTANQIGVDDDDDDSLTMPMSNQPKEIKDMTKIGGHVKLHSTTDLEPDLLCCKYNEDFTYLAAGGTDGALMLYKTSSPNQVFLKLLDTSPQYIPSPVTCIKHRPALKSHPNTNSFTCTYTNGFIKSWNYNFKQCIYTIREARQTYGLAYHPRLPKFVTFGDDKRIYMYDEETRVQERVLTGSANPKTHDGPRSRVFAACFNPRSNHELITGGWDDLVHFWDLRQPHAIRQLSGVHICGEGLDVNSKGTEILTCAFQKDNPLQLWDYGSGRLLFTLDPDQYVSKLYAGKFVASSTYIVCGGSDPNIFRIVDMDSQMSWGMLVDLAGGVYSIDVGPVTSHGKKVLPLVAFVAGKKLYQVEFY